MRLESRPQRQEHVLARKAQDALVLLNSENGEYYTLADVGARIWELCDGESRVSEIVAVLCGEYDAPQETLEVDVLELLGELSEEQLLVDVGAAA